MYRAPSPALTSHDHFDVEISSKQYPCPECSSVSAERVVAVKKAKGYDFGQIADLNRLRSTIVLSLARYLGEEMLNRGLLTIEEKVGATDYSFAVSVQAVHPNSNVLTAMESRIAERQDRVANLAISHAHAGINNWGSYYGQREIEKSRAIEMVSEGLTKAKADMAAWRQKEKSGG